MAIASVWLPIAIDACSPFVLACRPNAIAASPVALDWSPIAIEKLVLAYAELPQPLPIAIEALAFDTPPPLVLLAAST